MLYGTSTEQPRPSMHAYSVTLYIQYFMQGCLALYTVCTSTVYYPYSLIGSLVLPGSKRRLMRAPFAPAFLSARRAGWL